MASNFHKHNNNKIKSTLEADYIRKCLPKFKELLAAGVLPTEAASIAGFKWTEWKRRILGGTDREMIELYNSGIEKRSTWSKLKKSGHSPTDE